MMNDKKGKWEFRKNLDGKYELYLTPHPSIDNELSGKTLKVTFCEDTMKEIVDMYLNVKSYER